MNDYKIKVNNEAESKEAQELFFELGYGWLGSKCEYICGRIGLIFTTVAHGRNIISLNEGNVYHFPNHKEITLPQLRALVSEQKMASHNIEKQELKANPKLFLDPTQGYAEIEWGGSFMKQDHWVEVPEGAEIATKGNSKLYFWKSNDPKFFFNSLGEWSNNCGETLNQYMGRNPNVQIIWQRTQDEPFLTPESVIEREVNSKNVVQKANEFSERLKKLEYQFKVTGSSASGGASLMLRNSAESISIHGTIESKLDLEPQEDALIGIDATLAERQSTYGDFVHVANTTGKLFAEIKNGRNAHMLPYAQEEALHMICSKIARIVNGDCNHKDSWHDIAGYAKLIENLIKD